MPEALKLDPKKTAFIIIDMVNGIAKGGPGPAYSLPDAHRDMVANFQKMIGHCRKVGTPLIFITTHRRADNADGAKMSSDTGAVRHNPMPPGSAAVQVIDEMGIQPEDFLLVKPRFSAYYGTNLDQVLRHLGTETILVGGISTVSSVEGTARDARNRDTQCVVVSDCCTTAERDIHEITIKHVLPLLVRVRTTEETIAALS